MCFNWLIVCKIIALSWCIVLSILSHSIRPVTIIQFYDNVGVIIYILIIGQVFLLNPPTHMSEGDNLSVSFVMSRSKENHRLMEVELGCEIQQHSGKLLAPFKNKYYIE